MSVPPNTAVQMLRVITTAKLRRDLATHPVAFARRVQAQHVEAKRGSWDNTLASLEQRWPNRRLEIRPEAIDASRFARAFAEHGSDKSTKHNYHLVYSSLRWPKGAPEAILEIGLGTRTVSNPSSMGSQGVPGASHRAWAELFPGAAVIGADVDERARADAGDIESFWVDQNDRQALASLRDDLRGRLFDLIVDDGLHTPLAALNTFDELADLLSADGVYVIEDFDPDDATQFQQMATRFFPGWSWAFAHLPATSGGKGNGMVLVWGAGRPVPTLFADVVGATSPDASRAPDVFVVEMLNARGM